MRKTISVVIFDTPEFSIDFLAINNSIRFWNDPRASTCSNVTFDYATAANRSYIENEPIPNDTIFVLRPSTPIGQIIPEFRNFGQPSQNLRAAKMLIKASYTYEGPGISNVNWVAAHEAGHTLGLAESSTSDTVMGIAPTPTNCDYDAVRRVYCPSPTPTPTPTPTPNPPPDPYENCLPPFANGSCPVGTAPDFVSGLCCPSNCPYPPTTYACDQYIPQDPYNCQYTMDYTNCDASPILIDVLGNGFSLTDAANGVAFDVANHGTKQQVSWTSAGTDDAWLVLDRNGNGLINNGRELFGNATVQVSPPEGEERNGFLALREFDKTKNGGNSDGEIDSRDVVYDRLRLWQDTNHNGISEEGELHALPALNVATIELGYKKSKRMDEYGNEFRYRVKVKDASGAQVGRWAWDVFLVKE